MRDFSLIIESLDNIFLVETDFCFHSRSGYSGSDIQIPQKEFNETGEGPRISSPMKACLVRM